MALESIDWIILILYMILSLSIGLYYKSRAGKSISDYFLGGRNFPWWLAGISMVATTFAADTPLAVTELVGQNGIAGNWLWWNFLFGGMLTTFFFARLWRRSEVLTEVELIEFRYGGKAAAFLRGFKAIYLGLFMNAIIIGWVNVALIALLRVFFGIPEDQALYYVAAAMIITSFYAAVSGLWGVAITDVVQFIIAMTGCIVLAVLVLASEKIGGISGLKSQLPEGSLNFFPNIGGVSEGGSIVKTLTISAGTFIAYISVQWWASWYPGAEPGGGGYIAQRMMSAKNEKHSIFATLFFQIAHYCIRPWPWIIVGLCALVLYPELSPADKKLGYVMAMKDFLPAGLKGLLLVAFLAAYMSTISTQLNWGTSYLINDFYKRFIKSGKSRKSEEEEQKHLISRSRIMTFFSMAIALYATTQITSISGVWSFIIECGAGLGLVLILRWYWWRINAWSEITATIAPFIAYSVSRYWLDLEFPDSFFLTVGFTTLAWLTVTFLTKPEKEEVLLRFYEKVKPEGWWKPFRIMTGSPVDSQRLYGLVFCWLSAIVMTYSILFGTGKLIFQEYMYATGYYCIAIVSGLLLRKLVLKTRILSLQ
ncbi:MAG: sodium:proline symporter [Bacteroidetes bacterium]|nr:MAG: sodium:proline symporter [Bacteroidota bacterium]REK08098.1 MAG: sodium:proline symporter [Bacteroidota bacterium]REK32303.1 MAG: sodium:proline symporter [Bacteroidota bacterium]REK49537.1 MAG: sodium:proline symporter [Bacteroidota bacterium]